MKALGCLALVAAVAVVGFFALVRFTLLRGGEQTALTQRVDLVVISTPEQDYRPDQGSGYQFDYAYQYAGRWYRADDWIRDNYWEPGTPLTGCVDPQHPRDHVVTIRHEACGQDHIVGGGTQHAVPTERPDHA